MKRFSLKHFLIALAFLASGCSWGLRTPPRQALGAFAASPPERCASLSDRASIWGAVAAGAGGLAGASGLSTIPVTNGDQRAALAVTALALGAIATVATFVSQDASSTWGKEECGAPVVVKVKP